jgi:hypothetical protein
MEVIGGMAGEEASSQLAAWFRLRRRTRNKDSTQDSLQSKGPAS